jgi:hypothetical protein
MTEEKTSDDKIGTLIQRAIQIVEKVPEQYRLKAFEVVLSKILNFPLSERQEKREKEGVVGEGFEGKIAEFAAKCNLSIEQLKSIFDFQKDKPIFIIRGLGKSFAESQVLVSRYLLAVYCEVYGKEWVGLSPVLAEHGIGSLDNLAQNLQSHTDIFGVRGQGKATEYKLLDVAKGETFGMLHNLSARAT